MKANQKGFTTVLALGIISVVFLLILSGLLMVNLASKLITRQLLYQGQALNAAEAGLIDALNYFLRQPGTVTTYDPKWDDTALPVPFDDTAEPAIGIVRDYRVSDLGDVCGRYEVRRQDLDQNASVDPNEEGRGVQDITDNRGRLSAPDGNVWLLESHGYIYFDRTGACQLNGDGGGDPNAIPTVAPDYFWADKVLVRRTLRTQIQRMSINLPAEAALFSEIGTNIDIGNAGGDNVRLLGGPSGYGTFYSTGSDPANINPSSDVQGALGPEGDITPWNDEILEVFGVTQAELVGAANNSYYDAAAMPPSWSMKLYIVGDGAGPSGDGDFTAVKPLIGSGILVVFGNLNVPAGSTFQGFIYVTGTYTQEGPSLVSGAVMAKGACTIFGSGETAEIDYDALMMNQVQAEMIQYRFSRNPYLYTAK